jgi:hypothetical protein
MNFKFRLEAVPYLRLLVSACHREGPDSRQGQTMWTFCSTKRHWGTFIPSFRFYPVNNISPWLHDLFRLSDEQQASWRLQLRVIILPIDINNNNKYHPTYTFIFLLFHKMLFLKVVRFLNI